MYIATGIHPTLEEDLFKLDTTTKNSSMQESMGLVTKLNNQIYVIFHVSVMKILNCTI